MSEAVIDLENVSKTYGSGAATTKAVSDISMTVARGTWVAIMGPSGHGKSTLLQLIGGLDRPSAGRVVLDGAEIGSLDATKLAAVHGRKIGFVFQFFNLMPHLTALENVEIALWLGGAAKRNGRALELLERFGLGDKAHHLPVIMPAMPSIQCMSMTTPSFQIFPCDWPRGALVRGNDQQSTVAGSCPCGATRR